MSAASPGGRFARQLRSRVANQVPGIGTFEGGDVVRQVDITGRDLSHQESPTRVLIIEDHELVAVSLSLVLTDHGFATKVYLGGDPEGVLRTCDCFAPHVDLLDLDLGGYTMSGIDLISPLRSRGSSVVVLTGVTDRAWLGKAAREGADAILNKTLPLDELERTIEICRRGDQPGLVERTELLQELIGDERRQREQLAPFAHLTKRECDILSAIAQGISATTIASSSYVTIGTIRSQIHSILQKLEVSSQREAIVLARDSGWLEIGCHDAGRAHERVVHREGLGAHR